MVNSFLILFYKQLKCYSMMQKYLHSNSIYEKNVTKNERFVTSLFFSRTRIIRIFTEILFVTFGEITWRREAYLICDFRNGQVG